MTRVRQVGMAVGVLWTLVFVGLLAGCRPTGWETSCYPGFPVAVILSHRDGDVLRAGESVAFAGRVSDLDDRAADLTVSWHTNQRVVCEDRPAEVEGSTFCSTTLEEGEEEMSLWVTDPGGLVASSRVALTVWSDMPPLAVITSPAPGGVFYTDQSVPLSGVISDDVDAPRDLDAAWWILRESDGAQWEVTLQRGIGGQVHGDAVLETGRFQIELRVTDRAGKRDTAATLIEVRP